MLHVSTETCACINSLWLHKSLQTENEMQLVRVTIVNNEAVQRNLVSSRAASRMSKTNVRDRGVRIYQLSETAPPGSFNMTKDGRSRR